MTNKILLSKIKIPGNNIHRIFGEALPESEAIRYSEEIRNNIKLNNGLPSFDLILLGMGDDGHTASIFPDQMNLLKSIQVCAVAVHPESGQKRITLTGKVINNAEKIFFLITGKGKAGVVSEILEERNDYMKYPASHIHTDKNYPYWYLDKDAASLLNSN